MWLINFLINVVVLFIWVNAKTQIQEEGVLPVMVWFHGGGFFAGSAEKYLPQIILDHDVVLVVVQYRLGILGKYPVPPWSLCNTSVNAACTVT